MAASEMDRDRCRFWTMPALDHARDVQVFDHKNLTSTCVRQRF